jgi:hypothetical protein
MVGTLDGHAGALSPAPVSRRVPNAVSAVADPQGAVERVTASPADDPVSSLRRGPARTAGGTAAGPAVSVRVPMNDEIMRTDRKRAPSRLACAAAASAGAPRGPG